MAWWSSLVGEIARVGLRWLSRRRLPRVGGTLRVAALDRAVDVLRDPWGVPHIYAESEPDLYFAQGFVHAQDRLWQMDLNRRLVAGRLSEVFGADTVALDRWIRTLRMRWVAEREAQALPADLRELLEAYAAGVNACVAQESLPIEFVLLRYRPEPWVPADTLSWAKMMSWSLSVNWEAELLRQRLVERLGPERAAELEPDFLARCPLIIPPGSEEAEALSTAAASTLGRAEAASPFTGPSALDGVGSDNWAIGPSRSETGAPLFANDMHLGLDLPAIWYENHLVAGDLNLTGITFPGVPGVVSGHNGRVAWGFTNGFADVQDLYVEHLRHTDDGRVEVEFRGAWEEAQVFHEEIGVKNAETVTEDVIVTRHGPIINSLVGDFGGEAPLALRWTSLEPDELMVALTAMNRASDCDSFREALRTWSAPIQNTVYADTQGTIAYSLPGRIPIRAKGDGRLPVPGWSGEYEWVGYIPFDELPHMVNPSQGYIATANNRVVDDTYAHFLGYDYCIGDRAQRIVELIEAVETIDRAYAQRMQNDLVAPHARKMASFLASLSVDDADLAPVVEMMRDWDGSLRVDSAAGVIYEVFVREMIRLLLKPKVGDLAVRVAGEGPTPGLTGGTMFGERTWEWLEVILDEPEGYWFDLGKGETRDDCAREALRQALARLRVELGHEMSGWAWGKLHRLTLRHVLDRVSPLDRVFDLGPIPLPGDQNTLWATGGAREDVLGQQIVGPVYRMIVDLGDVRNSVSVLLPGQSGRVGSPHYGDQVEDWFNGGYHPMLYTRKDVEAAAKHRLQLVPGAF